MQTGRFHCPEDGYCKYVVYPIKKNKLKNFRVVAYVKAEYRVKVIEPEIEQANCLLMDLGI